MDGIKQTVMHWKVREKEMQSKVRVLRRFPVFFCCYSDILSFGMLPSRFSKFSFVESVQFAVNFCNKVIFRQLMELSKDIQLTSAVR